MTVPATGRRLVVALPAEDTAIELLGAAAELAVHLQRECVGLLIESEALVAAAALPFVRAVPTRSVAVAVFDPAASRRAMRVLAEKARRRLGSRMATTSLRWSLEIVRGDLGSLSLRAEDLLALGLIDPIGPGGTAAELALPCPLVMVAGGAGPVLVLFAGSAETLALGRDLASAEQKPLHVVVVPGGITTAEQLVEQMQQALGGQQGGATVLHPDEGVEIEAVLTAIAPSLVIVDSCGSGSLWRRVVVALQGRRLRLDLHQRRLGRSG